MNRLGSTALRFDSLPCTNDLAWELAESGESEGIAVIAREQTAGRGRQGRAWSSPPGAGLYVSLILRPRVQLAASPIIALSAAIAVQETLEQVYRVPSDIKWPNDVLARGRKICGILVEAAIEADKMLYAVMGIGVNLGQSEFPDELKETATSLLIECGQSVTPDEFLERLLDGLDYRYRQAIAEPQAVIARWKELSSFACGCPVRVEAPGGVIEGTTRGITETGALIVELQNGERREIVSGEVKLRKG
jgi:BirA family biotin operon repressor/biotin-[acetyl-CoA-carboxylase] ligase